MTEIEQLEQERDALRRNIGRLIRNINEGLKKRKYGGYTDDEFHRIHKDGRTALAKRRADLNTVNKKLKSLKNK